MIGTIDLYKLALTPNDTMYFDSVNAQTEWFNNQEHLSIDNISFNGDRAFRLGQNYLDVVFNYNYVRYKLNDRYIYAFIENVIYNNDNTSSLNISIDLNQTFLQELQTAISTSNVGNVTKKESYFETYKPYDNKLNVSEYSVINLGRLNNLSFINDYNTEFIYGFILLNVDGSLNLKKNSNDQIVDVNMPNVKDNGYLLPVGVVAFPIRYNLTAKRFELTTNVLFTDDLGQSARVTMSVNQFMSLFGSYIYNIGITFEPISSITYSNGVFYYDGQYLEIIEDVLNPFDTSRRIGNMLTITQNDVKHEKIFNLTDLNNIPLPLLRQPYCYIRVGNDYEYITLNLLDFFDNINLSKPITLKVEHFTSCLYPFVTNLVFYLNDKPIIDKNMVFNLTASDPIPYKLDAWEQYYATNKASVNDGLATQQKYEREISQNVLGTQIIQTSISAGAGIAKLGATTDPFQILSGVVDTVSSTANNLLGAKTTFNNSELQRQKEKALLDIKWNDIKSSPSAFSNMNSSITAKYNSGPQCIEVDIYIANNIDDIAKYHKQYGYKVNRMEKLTWQDIKQHTVFDYISFNTITLKSTLPQFYTAMIEQQYEQGVRFWYDYNNFMNYEIENEEVQ